MIDIEKLLKSPHITLRKYGIFRFRNICGFDRCVHETCKNCPYTNYYIRLKNSNREYRLHNIIQKILRKVWD